MTYLDITPDLDYPDRDTFEEARHYIGLTLTTQQCNPEDYNLDGIARDVFRYLVDLDEHGNPIPDSGRYVQAVRNQDDFDAICDKYELRDA